MEAANVGSAESVSTRPDIRGSSQPSYTGSGDTVPTTIHQTLSDENTIKQAEVHTATKTPTVDEPSISPLPILAQAVPFDPQRPLDFKGAAAVGDAAAAE